MSRKSKIDPVLKVELVEMYLRDEIGIREAAKQAGLSGNGTEPFRKWIDIYQNEGPAVQIPAERRSHSEMSGVSIPE